MAKHENNCMLIGLPKSGKSTFVAALWHVVESNELESSLTVTSLPEDATYLNELRNKWQSCSKFERNKFGFIKPISLKIHNKKTDNSTDFSFPDISGELFDFQFETRKIENDYYELLRNTNGIMLFINPDLLKKPILISDLGIIPTNDTISSEKESNANPSNSDENLKQNENNEVATAVKPSAIKKTWEHKDAPTQVKIVDILQMLDTKSEQQLNIAVIISAWDTIINTPDPKYSTLTPSQWIGKEMPLLEQFLETNSDLFNSKCFGVSAQGGDYKTDTDHLNSHDLPSKRIIVQVDSEISKDITLPIRWLLNE